MDSATRTPHDFGNFLRGIRSSRHVSLSGLAAKAGVAKSTLSKWETGQFQPRLPELDAILDALNVSRDERRRAIQMIDAPRALIRLRRTDRRVANAAGVAVAGAPAAGDLLRAMRRRRGWTVEKVAQGIGVSAQSVRAWERSDAWPTTDHLHSLCFLLDAAEGELTALANGPSFHAPTPLTALSSEEVESRLIDLVYAHYDPSAEPLRDLSYLALQATILPRALHSNRARFVLEEVYVWYAHWLGNNGRFQESARYAERALDLARRERAPDQLRLDAVLASTRAFVFRNGQRNITKRAAKASALLEPFLSEAVIKSPAHEAWALREIAQYLSMEGRTGEALEVSSRAVAVAELDTNVAEFRLRRFDRADLLLRAGRASEALATLPSDDAYGAWHPRLRSEEALTRSRALLLTGDASQAHDWLNRAYQIIQEFGLDSGDADLLARRF